MKKFRKFATLGLVLCAVSATLVGCRNEQKIAENLEKIKLGSLNAVSLDSGEIMVYETLKTEFDIVGKLETCVTETYIKFDHDGELRYDFTESKKIVSTGEVKKFEALKEEGTLEVSRDGKAVSESEAPDIFSYFEIDYETSDIVDIEVIEAEDGKTIYTVTMNEQYADRFDSEADGVKTVCEKVLYNYYLDMTGLSGSQLAEFTMSVDFDGRSQTVTRFVQTAINK